MWNILKLSCRRLLKCRMAFLCSLIRSSRSAIQYIDEFWWNYISVKWKYYRSFSTTDVYPSSCFMLKKSLYYFHKWLFETFFYFNQGLWLWILIFPEKKLLQILLFPKIGRQFWIYYLQKRENIKWQFNLSFFHNFRNLMVCETHVVLGMIQIDVYLHKKTEDERRNPMIRTVREK